MKRGTPDHPKVYKLAELLNIRRPMAVGYLELLFHFTATYAPQGDVGRYDDKRIAAAIDWSGNPAKLIESLVEAGWLDRHTVARLVVHDWHEHADRSVQVRLARQGKKAIVPDQQVVGKVTPQLDPHLNTKRALPEPVPDSMPVPEPEPEPQDSSPTSQPPRPPLDPAPEQDFGFQFARIYAKHPYKSERAHALAKWNEILQTSVNPVLAANAIEANHSLWIPYWSEPGRWKPTLFQYLDDQKFLSEPPDSTARARDAPAKDQRPKSKFGAAVAEAKRRSRIDEQSAEQ